MFRKFSKINRLDKFILFGLFLLLSTPSYFRNDAVDDGLIDILFKIRGERQLSEQILFVYISEADIQALGKWPITRDFYGYMTYVLSQLQAKVIAYDFLFDQPDHIYPEYDRILADFFESSGNVCLPVLFGDLIPSTENNSVLIGKDLQAQADIFQKHVAGVGFSNLGKSAILREIPIVAVHGDSLVLAFGAELARLFLGCSNDFGLQRNELIFKRNDNENLHIPFGKHAQLRLNHFGSLEKTNHIAFLDLLRAFETNPDSLRQHIENKLVIIAASSPSLPVLKATPFTNVFPAALIHATLAENIILGNYLRETPAFARILLVLIMVLAPALILRKAAIAKRVTAFVFLLLSYWAMAMIAFSVLNYILPLFYPSLALLFSGSFFLIRTNVLRHETISKEKAVLKNQIESKIAALATTEARLAEIERKLQAEQRDKATISEESRILASERRAALEALDKQLRDMQAQEVHHSQGTGSRFREIIHAANSSMVPVLEMVEKVANESIPVLLLGDTGTGKEMVAMAIHSASPRKKREFVAVNCGALPENLLESELFGHEKGSFTGAHSRRRGRFELANGGTIFLDEITETTPAFQVKLLRVLQDGVIERLGGEQSLTVDVRVICACNVDLKKAVDSSVFRADLYYRLNGFPIQLPPLRERPDDIPPLARHFLSKYGYADTLTFSEQAMRELRQHGWPGNIRELENTVRRAAILARSESRKLIRLKDLPEEIKDDKNIAGQSAGYLSFEEQILDALRRLKFSRSAISQTAKALGNRDRGTITEYFRGMCFQALVDNDFRLSDAAKTIADAGDEETLERVKKKIKDYLVNLKLALREEESSEDDLKNVSLLKGLPKQYHQSLLQVMKNLEKISEYE